MNLIKELKRRPDFFPNADAVRALDENITVLNRVAEELANGELGREVDAALRRQAEGWSKMAHQVVGSENF